MKQTISEYDFTRAFAQSDSRKNQFSYGALQVIFAYYEELEESVGEQIELDIIATCCDFTEYDTIGDAYFYHYGDDSHLQEDQRRVDEEQQREWLEENTTVLDVENINSDLQRVYSVVILNF